MSFRDKTETRHTETACTLQEVSRRGFGSLPFLYGEIKAGRLKVRKFGRSTRVLESDLQNWIATAPEGVNPKKKGSGGVHD